MYDHVNHQLRRSTCERITYTLNNAYFLLTTVYYSFMLKADWLWFWRRQRRRQRRRRRRTGDNGRTLHAPLHAPSTGPHKFHPTRPHHARFHPLSWLPRHGGSIAFLVPMVAFDFTWTPQETLKYFLVYLFF